MGTQRLYYEQVYLGETPTANGPESIDSGASHERSEALGAIERSNADILAAYPASAARKAVEERLKARESTSPGKRAQGKPRVLRFPTAMAGLAAACCVLAVSYLSLNGIAARNSNAALAVATEGSGAIRAKGVGPRLFVYLKEGDGARLLAPETRVSAGDVVQISYVADGDSFGAILSVDGGGVVTQHYPESGDLAGELTQTGEVPLDFSYRLDDAPRFERFFLVSGKSRFSVEWFRKRLAAANLSQELAKGKLPETAIAALSDALPAGVRITEILLRK
jgi:hypothetical protein